MAYTETALDLYAHRGSNSMMRNMSVIMSEVESFDERAIISQLQDDSFNRRSEILEELRSSVRTLHSLPFKDSMAVFSGLQLALTDSNWDVRHQCINLVSECIPHLNVDVDACISIILPRLIACIGDSKITIRRIVIQTLHTYMKHTSDMPMLMRNYIRYGLESKDNKVRYHSTVSLPLLITADFTREDYTEVIASLCKMLVDTREDDSTQRSSLVSLDKLRNTLGDLKFKSFLLKLSPQLSQYYCQASNFIIENGDISNNNNTIHLHFGIVPDDIMSQLMDQENFRSRGQAVEQLKAIVDQLYPVDVIIPHFKDFLSMLNTLLDDNNFKIITVTLDILGILVEKLAEKITPFLKPVIAALTKRMGDNKNVVRQAVSKVVMQLMHILGSKLVLLLLCDNLNHRNSRVRSETINCIINALLTFPSTDFDLPSLCSSIVHCLLDSKRAVRHACLECIAVLAQCLGAGKTGPLIEAVVSLEDKYRDDCGTGLVNAVHSRLQRRVLPRRNEDSLIEYAVQLPSLNSSRNGSTLGPNGADIDWILAGSGAGGSSARSMKVEDLESTSRQSSASLDGAGRRYNYSAGRNKAKLPWEDELKEAAPIKPEISKRSTIRQQRSELRLGSLGLYGSREQLESPVGGDYDAAGSATSTPTRQPFSKAQPAKSVKGELNSSWPNSRASKDELKAITGKPVLDPISAPETPVMARSHQMWPDENSDAAIPKKASTLHRSTSKKGKVPPIKPEKSQSPPLDRSVGNEEEPQSIVTVPILLPITKPTPPTLHSKSAQYLANDPEISHTLLLQTEFTPISDSGRNLTAELVFNASLNKIRNSATKKKAEKFFEKLEKKQSRSGNSIDTWGSPSKSPTENPFDSPKPKLVRHNSLSKTPESSEKQTRPSEPSVRQPKKSVRQETEDMVAIVGRGYGDDGIETPPKQNQNRTKRKVKGGSSLSPLGMSAQNAPGLIPLDDESDFVSIVKGKGGIFHTPSKHRTQRKERTVVYHLISPDREFSSRLEGMFDEKPGRQVRGERSNSISKQTVNGTQQEDEQNGGESDEEMHQLHVSRAVRENAARKKREKEEESARRRAEREAAEELRIAENEKRRIEQAEAAERRKKEREAANEKRRKQLERKQLEDSNQRSVYTAENDPSLSIAGNSPAKPPSGKLRMPARHKTSSPPPSSASSLAASTHPSDEQLRPFSKPEATLKEALKLIKDSEWSQKVDGLNRIRSLAQYHPDMLCTQLHTITLQVLLEVKNLRSQVARLAVIAMGDMFSQLGKALDPELEACAKVLLHKNGESNDFIRSELDRTLSCMVGETTPLKAFQAVINGGIGHKNAAVRKVSAQHLATLCEKIGPGRLLSGVKDVTERILPVLAGLVLDASPETRWYGRKILMKLINHADFDTLVTRYVSSRDVRHLVEVVENLKAKGLGDMPSDSPSAKGTRKSGTLPRSRQPSAADSVDAAPSTGNSGKKRALLRMGDDETVKSLLESMGSNVWSKRYDSIDEFAGMTESQPHIISAQSVKLFDRYAALVRDVNSKVALHAMKTLVIILPSVKDDIGSNASLLIQNTAAGLASKNGEILDAASGLLDAYINNMDHLHIFQPFIQVGTNATAKTKPDIIDRINHLCMTVYPRKQKAVVLHALPFAFNLVGSTIATSASGALRDATVDLIKTLYDLMGLALLDHAAGAPGTTAKLGTTIKEMLK